MYDFENWREKQSLAISVQRHIFRVAAFLLGQVLINFTFSYWISFPLSFAMIFTQVYGVLRLTSLKESMIEIASESTSVIIQSTVLNLLLLLICQGCIYFLHHRYLVVINDSAILHDEIKLILTNLDEAIICKTNQGISFCNNLGWTILQNIVKADKSDSSFFKRLLPESLLKNGYLSTSMHQKKNSQIRFETKLLDAKIFEVKENMYVDNDKPADMNTASRAKQRNKKYSDRKQRKMMA